MGRLSLFWLYSVMFVSSVQADDHNEAYKLLQKGEILPLEKILQLNLKNISGKVLEVELEREKRKFIYEIEVLNNDGVVWEYKIDAKTGKIIDKELD